MAHTSAKCSRSQNVSAIPGLAMGADETIVGRYRVEELLRSGAAGVVVAARHIHLRAPVVLTILASYTEQQEELLQGQLRRARLAGRLQGPHVARVVDIGETADGMRYIATERLEGKTLETELAERGALGVEEAVRWALEACAGLAEAHAFGFVHGDLKPQSILFAEVFARDTPSSTAAATEGTDRRVLKILGFGTPSSLDAIGDQSLSAFFGSPAFLAPEQLENPGAVDARADVWALGVLLYNMLSGTAPFEAETLSGVMLAVVQDAPALLTNAPCGIALLVHRCLEKDPANRPQDVMELASALAPFAGGQGAKLVDRVRAIAEAPLNTQRTSRLSPPDATSSGSIPPVSLSVAPPPLLPTDEMTQPSMHVVAGRRARWRTRALASLGALVVVGLATWATVRSSLTSSQGTRGDGIVELPRRAHDPSGPREAPSEPSLESISATTTSTPWTAAIMSLEAGSPAALPTARAAALLPCPP